MIQRTPQQASCPNCLTGQLDVFLHVGRVPAHSVLLLASRAEAIDYPRGEINLAYCESCGFIANTSFDPGLHEYSASYEATQSFSDTFNTFHRQLAANLIDRYDLRGKRIIEIGCGQGEFIELLREMGGNRCLGFDPAYRGTVGTDPNAASLAVIADFYSEKYATHQADFICCKMTLEHIHDPACFVETLKRALGKNSRTIVFMQVPDATRILQDVAFWDIYYEHCSYFTPSSLTALFASSGFTVRQVATDYDDQYLMIEADASRETSNAISSHKPDAAPSASTIASFADRYARTVASWKDRLSDVRAGRRRAVLWGGGSKGVAFLNALDIGNEIPYAVDINPRKHGSFMAGTGQEIVAPETLKSYRPDIVIAMNPVYLEEIRRDLDRLSVKAELWPLE